MKNYDTKKKKTLSYIQNACDEASFYYRSG